MAQTQGQVQLLDDDGTPLLDDNGSPLFDTPNPTPAPVLTMSSNRTAPSELEQMIMNEYNPQPQQSGLSRIWSALSTPLTDAPSRVAGSLANWIDKPRLPSDNFDGFLGSIEDAGNALNDRVRGFGAGAVQGIGDMLSQMTSPVDLATTLATMGSGMAAKQGLSGTARGLNAVARAAGAGAAIHGGSNIYEGATEGDLGKMGMGAVELAGGAAGVMQPTPHVTAKANILSASEVPPRPGADIFEATLGPDAAPDRNSPIFAKNQPTGVAPDIVTPPTTPNMPKTIYVKPSNTAIADIKKATEAGYEHAGLDERGRVKMVYTGKPKDVGLLETEVMNKSGGRGRNPQKKEQSTLQEVLNFPRAVMASTDFSAPLRQGLPLIHKKEFWTSLDDMFRAWVSEENFNDIQKSILMDKNGQPNPLFKKRVGPDGKEIPSFAEQAGLKLSDLNGLEGREEALMSTWAEMIPGVRRSNRAYTAFLNKLRADTFSSLVNDAKIFAPGSDANMGVAKELANFVNTASGRGSLGRLESSAKFLNSTLFAPRLIASRLQMLNPHYYWAANPQVRKEAMKSLLAVVGTGTALGQLAKLAGAEVHTNPTSADFGKIKIGDVRLDPFAGFQQYAVLASRLLSGEVESTTTGNTYQLGEKFGRPTRLDILGRFIEGKANPILSFVTGLLRGKDFVGKPFDVPEELASRVTPIYLQDLKEILTENPNLIPFYHDEGAYQEFHPENIPYAVPPLFGMGMQQYGTMK